jgi:hypothetical protein
MSKRARTNGSRAIERRLADDRGKGRGPKYTPWIMIHDVPSLGLATRMKSPLNGRTYHLLSQLETDWLYALHALPGVIDIREQFPLLELEETLAVADQLGIAHPTDPATKEPCVPTTDFLVTLTDGARETDIAIAIKPAAELGSSRTLEKLEIERIYWSARNINWRVLSEKELPKPLVKNLRWIYPHLDLVSSGGSFTVADVKRIRAAMEPMVLKGDETLVAVTAACDDRLGVQTGSALCVVRHLIATGAWPVDLTVEIDPRQPLRIIEKGVTHAHLRKLAA